MTKQLKWRLGKLPTSEEVLKLVNDKIITKDEAREILFNEESTEERDKKSLEQEIKFLREIIEKLSNNKPTEIVKIIEYMEKPYQRYPWVNPYINWCSSTNNVMNAFQDGLVNYQSTDNLAQNSAFTAIQTF